LKSRLPYSTGMAGTNRAMVPPGFTSSAAVRNSATSSRMCSSTLTYTTESKLPACPAASNSCEVTCIVVMAGTAAVRLASSG